MNVPRRWSSFGRNPSRRSHIAWCLVGLVCVRPLGRTVTVVVVAAYSFGTVLFNTWQMSGAKYSASKKGREQTSPGDTRRTRVMTTAANELMEWVENICRFTNIRERAGVGAFLGDGRNDRNLARVTELKRLLNRWLSYHQMDVCDLVSGMCPQISIDMTLMSCNSMLGLEVVVRNKRCWLCYCQRGNRKQRNSFEAPRRNGGDRFRVLSG
jgi:hypothetical protein